jgi:GNAT superfamily N-acetyltransferase
LSSCRATLGAAVSRFHRITDRADPADHVAGSAIMQVRPIERADHDAVLALASRLAEGVAPWRDPHAVASAVRGWVEGAVAEADDGTTAVFVLVGEHGDTSRDEQDVAVGGVRGFVSVRTREHWSGAREGYVGELVVAEHAEGHGGGSALMAAAEDWVRDQGLDRVSVDTGAANSGARDFYTALGYEEEDVRLSRGL